MNTSTTTRNYISLTTLMSSHTSTPAPTITFLNPKQSYPTLHQTPYSILYHTPQLCMIQPIYSTNILNYPTYPLLSFILLENSVNPSHICKITIVPSSQVHIVLLLSLIQVNLFILFKVFSYNNSSNSHKCFKLKLSTLIEPFSYTRATTNLNWHQAINNELQSLNTNHTWDFVSLPPTKRPIDSK